MELKNKRIVFLGDSITEGYGTSSEEKTFHQLLKEKYQLSLASNCGVGGTRIARQINPSYANPRHDLYFRLRATVMPKDADIVIWSAHPLDIMSEASVVILNGKVEKSV